MALTETEQLRKLSNIICESTNSQLVMIPHSNNTRSVDLSKTDPAVAAALQSNPRTKGTFYFNDEGDGNFQWGGTGQFIEMAHDAASEFCRRNNTKFARLVLHKVDLAKTKAEPGTRDYY